MNILLPTDFSAGSKNTAGYAMELFAEKPCTFYLLHAFSFIDSNNKKEEIDVPPEFYANFEALLSWLEEKKVNVQHEFKVVFKQNYFIEAVRETVRENGIDLIVMGTKGFPKKKSSVIGKNTTDVMMKVRCPVLAVSEDITYKKQEKILFPTDYKIQYNKKSLDVLLDLVSLSKASVKVMELFTSKSEPSPGQAESKASLQNYFSSIDAQFFSYSLGVEKEPPLLAKDVSVDMIAIVAKNLSVCQKFLNQSKNSKDEVPFPRQLPLLMLH